MKRFNYRAKDTSTGKMVKGVLQAESEHAAGRLLVEQGFVPDKISEDNGGGILGRFFNRIKTKDKVNFSRQFSTLIGAGLPLANSLKTVAEQTDNKAMREVIETILSDVEAGRSLTEAFSRYPDVFDNVYLALVRAGEASGTLDEALRRLADQQEKDAAMISKIRGAMVYPAILLVVIIAVLAFMMIEVVPEVQNLYEDMGEELPWLTALLVSVTDFFASFWWLVANIVGFIVFAIIQFRRTDTGKRVAAQIKLHLPIFKGMFQRLYMTRFAHTAEMLLSTGVSMLEAIKIAAHATSNPVVESEIMKGAEEVKGGKPLSEALEGRSYILPLVPQMASIGEQSGKIDEMLARAANVYENELEEQIANISTMIEPVLMVAMAGLIAIVIAGTLLPIYSLVSSIS